MSQTLLTIPVEYEIGEVVYIKSDPEQMSAIVIGYVINPGNSLMYKLAVGLDVTYHYDVELTLNKGVI
jgi:hypothetical protein